MDEKCKETLSKYTLFKFNPNQQQEVPAIGNLPKGPVQHIYDFLLPHDQLSYTRVNRRHHRWFFTQNNLTREIFNQEKERVLEIIKKHKLSSKQKHIIHANFIPLLADVFGVEKNNFHTSEAFELALIQHARQLTPRGEWYTLVPFPQPLRQNVLVIRILDNSDSFEYTVITPQGIEQTDTVCVKTFKDFPYHLPLTIEQLRPVLSCILDITEARGHTFKELGKHLRGNLEIQNATWLDSKRNNSLICVEFAKLSMEVVKDLASIYQNYYNMSVDVGEIYKGKHERSVIILPREEFCMKCLSYFNTGPLGRLDPHQRYQLPIEQFPQPGIWENHDGIYGNQQQLMVEDLSVHAVDNCVML